jgi:tetratricopeptide (TPR) repeat protein
LAASLFCQLYATKKADFYVLYTSKINKLKKIVSIVIITCINAIAFAQPNSVFKKADSIFNSQNYALAKTEYENILKTDPGTALAWNRLGFSCYNLNQYDEAIKHFTKSLSLNPSDQLKPFVLIRLAKSYGAKNDKENAIFFLQKAVEAGSLNWNEINTDKNLQLLKNEPGLTIIKEMIFAKINPCMSNPKNREFDFWVGEWDVVDTKTGRKAGTNTITVVSGGCMLLENWMDVTQTGTGTSINYVNTETGKWEQIYKDNGIGMPVKYTDGEYINGVMKFSVVTKGSDGKMQAGRFVFEKKSADEVRQYQEMTADEGKTWTMAFDLTYRRRK